MAALSVFLTLSSSLLAQQLAQEDSLNRHDEHFHILTAAVLSGIAQLTWHVIACFCNSGTDKQERKKKSSMLWIEFLKCSCMSSEDSSSSEVVHAKFEEMRAEKHASNVEFLKVRVIFSFCVVWQLTTIYIFHDLKEVNTYGLVFAQFVQEKKVTQMMRTT